MTNDWPRWQRSSGLNNSEDVDPNSVALNVSFRHVEVVSGSLDPGFDDVDVCSGGLDLDFEALDVISGSLDLS